MSRRLIIFDIALVVLLVFGVMKFREDWLAFEPVHRVSDIQPKPEAVPALPAAVAGTTTPATDWAEIPGLNPFSFDRNDIAILEPAAPPKPVGPPPLLYGTMMLGQGWMAMLASSQGNNRSSRPMKIGESIDGWTVVEIADKKVVIEANASRETLSMDPTQVVPREHTRTATAPPAPIQSPQPAAPVTTVGSSAPTSPASSPSNTSPPAAQEMCDVPTPFGAVLKRPCKDVR